MRFDTRTQQLTRLPAVPFDVNVSAARTEHSFGCLGASNTATLPQSVPTANTVTGTQFAQRVRAASRFERLSFPGRTAVSFRFNRTLGRASGTLIGERFVLTAAHNLIDFATFQFNTDSLLIEPAYDDGRQSLLPAAWAHRFYVPVEFFQGRGLALDYDVAIIELAQPIGRGGGWLGFGYNTDTAQVKNGVWHKFSYPGQDVIVMPNRYNSDTLFYEYGRVFASQGYSGFHVPNHFEAAFGQSGSSFFRTDSRSYWTIYAVASEFHEFIHATIPQQYFAAFQKVIRDNPAASVQPLEFYPNPVSNQGFLQLPTCAFGPAYVEITDMLGRIVRKGDYPQSKSIIKLDLSGLASGSYFLRAKVGTEQLVRRFIKVE
jgi:hypothetical protein